VVARGADADCADRCPDETLTSILPFALQEMNAMERELLIHLSWTIYISPDECVGSRSLSSKPLS
jgi:hypothetical protein